MLAHTSQCLHCWYVRNICQLYSIYIAHSVRMRHNPCNHDAQSLKVKMLWQQISKHAATPAVTYCIFAALHKCMDYATKLLATQDLTVDMLTAVVGGFTLRIYWVVVYLQPNAAMLLLHVDSASSPSCTGWSVTHRAWCNGHVYVTMSQARSSQ